MTVTNSQWIQGAAAQILAAGQMDRTEAHVRARLLLDWVTGNRHAHLLHPQATLTGDALQQAQAGLEQVLSGRPLPYVVGRREFYGRSFACDERALIPRPETELLIDTVVPRARAIAGAKMADLGTGSGCIAITLALELPDAHVFATDSSCKARSLAEENAESLGAPVTFLPGFVGDWLAPLQAGAPYDFVVSNPPYIAAGEIDALQREISQYEPRLALDGGADGLEPYRQIAAGGPTVLRAGGQFVLELGAFQFEQVSAMFVAAGMDVEPPIRDLAGHDRVLVARF